MNFLACCGVKHRCPKPQQKKQEYSPAFSVPFLLWAINMDIYLVDNIFCEVFLNDMRGVCGDNARIRICFLAVGWGEIYAVKAGVI